MLQRLAFTALCLGASASAQVVSTSPAGLLNTPGDYVAVIGEFSFPGNWSKLTQIDATQPPVPRVISALSFRRPTDGNGANGGVGNLAIRMAHADYSLVTGGTDNIDSLLTGPWVDVFTLKPVPLPTWNQPGNPPPAAFDFRIPFDVPFSFNGRDALMIQVLLLNSGVAFDATDRAAVSLSGQPYGVGLGCRVGTREVNVGTSWYVDTETRQTSFFVTANLSPGIVGAQSIAMLGLQPVNLPIPGICAPILSSGEVFLPLRAMFFNSSARSASITLPYTPEFVGQLDLYVQAWAQLSGQPQPFIGSYGARTGPLPAPRTDGFRAAMINDVEGGASFTTDGNFSKNKAAILGLE